MSQKANPEITREAVDLATEKTSKRLLESVLSEAPRWLLAVAGLAYATGFLVVSVYLESFGVKDTTGEVLRLRYLTIGFYFLMFLGSLMTVAVTLVGAHRQNVEVTEALRASLRGSAPPVDEVSNFPVRFVQSLFRFLLLLVVIALVVGLAPFPSSRLPLIMLAISVCLTLVGAVWIDWVRRLIMKLRKEGVRKPLQTMAIAIYKAVKSNIWLYVLSASLLVLDGWIVLTFRVPFRRLWRVETALFVIFLLMLAYVAYHSFFRRRGLSGAAHRMFMGTRIALSLALYYLCVLSFVYGIYPLMPEAKGGGRFSDAGRVVLVLRGNGQVLPHELMDKCNRTSPLVLIEQEPNVLYVANPSGAEKWIEAAIRPTVYEVQMSDVLSVEHHPR
jgi:hypothetical protein